MKLILTINDGSLAGRRFDLESGFLTVGRNPNCSVQFDPQTERIASGQHAFIETRADGFYLTDNQSTNGTLLNGTKINSGKLSSGDVIQFGTGGTTAQISIEGQSFAVQQNHAPQQQSAQAAQNSFRDFQQSQFNRAAENASQSAKSISQIGLGNIQTTSQKSSAGKYIGIAVAIFSIVFLSLIVSLIMFASVGPVAAVIASFIAFIPAMFYILPLFWLDRYDPEPVWLLALAFAWGALFAVFVSFIVNTVIGIVAGGIAGGMAGELVGGVISAPIFEEGTKGLGVLLILIFFRKEFDDILDGIIYAGVIALGFATVENVLYYGRELAGGGNILFIFIIRGIFSPFAHVTFTSMTGIGCGISRESHNTFVKIAVPFLGYCCAVLLHATWNGMAFLGGFKTFAAGYFILEVPFFLIFVGFAFYIMHRQNKILKEMLSIDVATGVVPQKDFETATSAFKSTGWLLGGIFSGKYRARSHYLRAIGKLGLSSWHIQRATAAQGQTASFQQNPILRDEVLKWRDKV